MKIPSLRRVATLAASLGLAVGTLAIAPAASANTSQARAGAEWIVGELSGGLLKNEEFGSNDIGLSIDALLAFKTVGGYGSEVKKISNAVADNLAGYVDGAIWGDKTDSVYANATAKALYAAQQSGKDGADYGGYDLVAQLDGAVISSSDADDGRLEDDSTFGDYANSIGQAFAAASLTEAGSANAERVTDYLLKQQCSDGYFRLYFDDEDSATQTCDAAAPDKKSPDTDTTALAIEMLSSQKGDAPVDAAIAKAVDWLLETQRADGSFGGGASTEAPNSNSTGLAGYVLGIEGEDAAAAKAAAWVQKLQVGAQSACGTKLLKDRGAIAYDRAAWNAGHTAGLSAATVDTWRRASTQAVRALVNYSAPAALPAKNLTLTGPAEKYSKAGSSVTLSVSGLQAGEFYCVESTAGVIPGGAADASGTAKIQVKLPAETTTTNVSVTGSTKDRKATIAVESLAAEKLNVKVKKQVVKNKKQKVIVKGLAPKEQIRWTLKQKKTKKVRTGVANKNGVFKKKFKVGKKFKATTNNGKMQIKVRGEFKNRKGAVKFQVK